MKAGVIIAAAGQGQRIGFKKQYHKIKGIPMLIRATRPFTGLPFVSQIIICVPRADKGWVERELLPPFSLQPEPIVVEGGATRQETIELALEQLAQDVEIVLVHDGARPFVSTDLVRKVFSAVREKEAVVPAIPVRDTVKTVNQHNLVTGTPEREKLRLVQTPQGFSKSLLIEAYRKARTTGWKATDDAAIMERAGYRVYTIPGEEENIKVTTRNDLKKFSTEGEERTGLGLDIHPLENNRRFVLGGVEIPSERGCAGHSDGDVLTHALMDALLGAAGLQDIGHFFPDSEEKFRDAYSIELLEKVVEIIGERGWKVKNADCTVVLEMPKIAPHIERMKEKISQALGIFPESLGVKATTAEKLGFIGRGEGVFAQAIATINREMVEGGNTGEG